MTTQLATLLVQDYEAAIKKVQDSQKDVSGIIADLYRADIGCGICYLAMSKHGVHLYGGDSWIDSIDWINTPYMCDTKQEILESLNFRLNKLKQFLKS